MKAIKDLWYLLAVWALMRLNPITAGEILERWGRAMQDREKHPLTDRERDI